jgi:hypothetical protein
MAGIALLFWCVWDIDVYLVVAAVQTVERNWRYWGNLLQELCQFSPANQATYAKLWWIACLAASVYLIGWNSGFARLLWRGLWVSAGKCSKCGYDRSGLASGKACPECGTP